MSKRQSTDEQAENSSSRNQHWNAKYHEKYGNSHVLFHRESWPVPSEMKALRMRKAARTGKCGSLTLFN
jgi:hypothetical protein